MKIKTTKKEVRSKANIIISVGYCEMYCLLSYERAFSYCTRAEGWACDNYEIRYAPMRDVVISTGYAPINDYGFKNSDKYSIIRMYEEAARNAIHDSTMSYEEKEEIVHNLLINCINDLMK